ncbi:MAG: CDP-diacylglycerol--glycerol-3-phosphate 3-phosphatidyltransferase [Desulfobacterales bacterium]|jgi:CDP-diacylglycerol--glycerol-3-phosphate 3-phosphatidyltransferase|nr:CDP-diacylglycerol--glycerol-3-phosphate 3-phosphatidyltransferase [Desulfobacterales bacterium]MDD3082504.1 CDP-diacylglycerol--glycerol-3-phosphate 3-phosphatidyltransferase [Desulfobacterales bacterium]MDD3951817.1 CDP-diacylglycerol--glycerol-3-phosphate 3-phosphatidyltransferase [Desulfobacterales bacterium]MDD4464187.1 CDP-diacylglycerol--glycerol-3-phosphate 3-phosphatidyltransferase [Desulfobacterales bacterium]MDY0377714.1 CDP-diacylglycerol--glycerol-3-phosphate 3-phosphatidyltrans
MSEIFSRDKIKFYLSDPNTLTLARVAAVPVIVVLLLFPNRPCTFLAALLFSAASITDYLDGFFARRQGLTSEFGKIMDPLADKLLSSLTLIMLSGHGWIPAWVVCVIIGRELSVTGLRNAVSQKGKDASASWLGKYKTGFQIAAIIPLLFHYPYFGIQLHAIGMVMLWAALILTVWSGIDYMIRYTKILRS